MDVELGYCLITKNISLIPIDDDPKICIHFQGKYLNSDIETNIDISVLENVENLIFSVNLCHTYERGDFTVLIENSLQYCEQSNFFSNLKNVFILYTNTKINEISIKTKYKIEKISVLYFLLRSHLTERLSNYKFTNWYQSNRKCLTLVGDVSRESRFPVLFEFYKNNNLDILDYSLNYNYSNNYDSFDKYFNRKFCNWLFEYMSSVHKIDKLKFLDLFKSLENNLLEDDFMENTHQHWINKSAFLFPKQWGNCSVILYGETLFDLSKSVNYNEFSRYFTEKTWKPICSKKPFISCSNNDWISMGLEKFGFKNFLQYTDYPEYIKADNDYHQNIKKTAEISYQRVSSFLRNINKFKDNIYDDIEHNYSLWKKLSQKNFEDLLKNLPILSTFNDEEIIDLFLLRNYKNYTFKNLDTKTLYI